MKEYHTLLATSLSGRAFFLAEECISFDGSLVRQFCQKALTECLQSSSPDLFHNVPHDICESIDKSWESRHLLILDMLGITLKCSLCECKVGLVKAVNKSLEFVLYCVKSLSSASMDICRDASKLLYKYGWDFYQVSPPVASVLFLYVTGLNFKSSNIESDASPIFGFFDNVEKQQTLTDSLGALANYFRISSDNKLSFKPERKESDSSFEVLESVKAMPCKNVHGNFSLWLCMDALEYLCLLLVEYATAMWEDSISRDMAACNSNDLNYVHDALHQFCDFFLAACGCTKTSKRDQEWWRRHSRSTVLRVAVSALKISPGNFEIHKNNFSYFERFISSAWIEPSDLKYSISVALELASSLKPRTIHMTGTSLPKQGRRKETTDRIN